MSKLLAFDLETTGLDTGTDRIIEFCFVSLDENFQTMDTFKSLVNPEKPIPPESSAIHRITDADVSNVPTFDKHAERIQELIADSILIAHAGSFDMAVLNAELMRSDKAGISPTHPLIDTLMIERYVNSHKLESAYERYVGEKLQDAHRAEADTLATVAVLKGQIAKYQDKLPKQVHQLIMPQIQKLAGHEIKEFLDHDRRFYRDSEGVVRINFGQHRGVDANSRKGYLEWMLRREFSADTMRVVKKILKA